jgi:hypothetical protein
MKQLIGGGGGGGGGGTPGGSTTQVQFNNAGAFGGISTFTYDGTTLTTAGRFVNSYNATASTPAKSFTGTWFTGGSATTTKPQVLIEPTGATSTAWSTSGTGLGVNAASGFAGNLLDLQVNGTSHFKLTVGSTGALDIRGSNESGQINCANTSILGFYGAGFGTQPLRVLTTGGLALGSSGDTVLIRDAANTLAQRSGTNAQINRLYNTYTDDSNYERLSTTWSSNVCYTKPENAGTGSARLYVPVTGATTVSGLPAAATAGAGARAFVTDATLTVFLSTVAGGGANKVPVVSDGTNWLIG